MPDFPHTPASQEGAKAMTIFLVLNGMAVVFMLYVLVNFWKEGRRTTHGGVRSYDFQSLHGSEREVFVVTRPLEFEVGRPGKRSLIRFPAPVGRPREDQVGGESAQGGGRSSPRKYSSG
jgi:hypothetical protein